MGTKRLLNRVPDLRTLPQEEHPAAKEYDEFLSELTFNSKPVINNLTMIAHENILSHRAICHVIESRISLADPQRKLPLLYLLDSIVKNIGREYTQRFRLNIFKTFTDAYDASDQATRASLRKLLGTWGDVFGQQLCELMWRRVQERDKRDPPVANPAAHKGAPHRPTPYDGIPKRPRYDAQVPAPPSQIPATTNVQTAPSKDDPMAQLQEQTRMLTTAIADTMLKGQLPSYDQLTALNALIGFKMQSGTSNEELATLMLLKSQIEQLQQSQSQAPPAPPTQPAAPAQVPPTQTPTQPLASQQQHDPLGLFPSGMGPTITAAVPQPVPPSGSQWSNGAGNPRDARAAERRYRGDRGDRGLCDSFQNIKSADHRRAVRLLYDDLPHQSKADGARFATVEALRKHLDWLFEKNKRRSAKHQGASSRAWYLAQSAWASGDSEDAANAAAAGSGSKLDAIFHEQSKPAVDSGPPSPKAKSGVAIEDGDNEVCPVCGEKFETFWDDDEQTWKYADAFRAADGLMYHTTCGSTSPLPEMRNAPSSTPADQLPKLT